MQSDINLLQEYFQKRKLKLPEYSYWKNGLAHELQWYCKVTIYPTENPIMIQTEKPSASKSEAKMLAAQMALEKINSSNLSQFNIHFNTSKSETMDSVSEFDSSEIKTIYLIDMENKPCFKLNPKPDCLYIGFINSIHHSIPKYNHWHLCQTDRIYSELESSKSNRLYYVIEGPSADLADHLMTAMSYPIVRLIRDLNKKLDIRIISGDHAGWCTRSCLEMILKWHSIDNVTIYNSSVIAD